MDEQVIVQRANVVLQISPQQVDYYLNQGYNVIDEKGNVIQKSIPRNLGELQKAYIDHIAEIESLKEEIRKLKEPKKPARKKTENAE